MADTELAVIPAESLAQRHELSVEEVVARVNKVHDVMKRAMQDGHHYGVIPGTPKPTLLKPGAELLCVMFRLDPEYSITPERAEKHLTIHSTCTLYHVPTGQRVGSGMGSCSTRESKYAYRTESQKCPKCNQATIIKGKAEYGGGWLCFKKKGGCGEKFKDDDLAITHQVIGRIANEDLADQENTVLKMANKRSLVAAVLNVTAASDIFTQDLEDAPHETAGAPTAEPAREAAPLRDSEEEANRLFPDEPAAEPVRQPNEQPVEVIDRAVLIGKIKGAADVAKLTSAEKATFQKKYLGGASVDKADLAALSDLLRAIREYKR